MNLLFLGHVFSALKLLCHIRNVARNHKESLHLSTTDLAKQKVHTSTYHRSIPGDEQVLRNAAKHLC